MAGGQLVIRFVGDVREWSGAAKKVQGDITGLGRTVGKATAFGTVLGNMFSRLGGRALRFAGDSVQAFLESEKAVFQWGQAVKLAEGLGEDFVDVGLEMAAALQKQTGFQDEAILGIETVLSRFKLEEAELKRLTPLVLDYARATGQDAVSSAESIGKALLGNTRALKTVGINYKATGDRAEDLANLMTLLEGAVGGTAKEFGETLPGQMEIAQATFDDFKEQVGSIPATIVDFAVNGANAAGIISDAFRQMAIDAKLAHEPVEDAAVILRDYALAADVAAEQTKLFAGLSISEFKDWKKDTVGSVDAVGDALDALGDKANVTADDVIKAFNKQARDAARMSENLRAAVMNGLDPDLAKLLLDEGIGRAAPVFAAAADAGEKKMALIEKAIAAVGGVARNAGGDLVWLKQKAEDFAGEYVATIRINVVGGIPAGVGGGVGGPGPGGQTSGASIGGGVGTVQKGMRTFDFRGAVFNGPVDERAVEEAFGRIIDRWDPP